MFNKQEYKKQYYFKNKEKIKERKAQYYFKNKEKIKERKAQYYLNNKNELKEKQKQHYLSHKNEKCKYYLNHKDKIKKYQKLYRLKIKYKLTIEQYNELLIKYNNQCAICHKKFKNDTDIHIDHNHITGKVRGLLCNKHNLLLGMADDNITILNNSIKYLESFNH